MPGVTVKLLGSEDQEIDATTTAPDGLRRHVGPVALGKPVRFNRGFPLDRVLLWMPWFVGIRLTR